MQLCQLVFQLKIPSPESECEGIGAAACLACNGMEKIKCKKTLRTTNKCGECENKKYKACPYCEDGSITCPDCGEEGTTNVYNEENYETGVCPTCRTEVTVKCTVCKVSAGIKCQIFPNAFT